MKASRFSGAQKAFYVSYRKVVVGSRNIKLPMNLNIAQNDREPEPYRLKNSNRLALVVSMR